MQVTEAQREVRDSYRGGFMGQLGSGLVWLASATAAAYGTPLRDAFVLPLTLPVVGAVALHRVDWFYPAFMVVLGAHYLPFVFLYGMRLFAPLSLGLVGLGVAFAYRQGGSLATPAWLTGLILLGFGALGFARVFQEQATMPREPSGA